MVSFHSADLVEGRRWCCFETVKINQTQPCQGVYLTGPEKGVHPHPRHSGQANSSGEGKLPVRSPQQDQSLLYCSGFVCSKGGMVQVGGSERVDAPSALCRD